jgi:hypothetical protein
VQRVADGGRLGVDFPSCRRALDRVAVDGAKIARSDPSRRLLFHRSSTQLCPSRSSSPGRTPMWSATGWPIRQRTWYSASERRKQIRGKTGKSKSRRRATRVTIRAARAASGGLAEADVGRAPAERIEKPRQLPDLQEDRERQNPGSRSRCEDGSRPARP